MPDSLENSGAAADGQSTHPAGSAVAPCPLKAGWIEIELLGEEDLPVANEKYKVVLPDASERVGKTDARGVARVEGFPLGTCKIVFPDLDERSVTVLE